MLERDYQAALIKRIKELLPGCIVLKNDSGYMQGVPDLTVLYGDRWGVLEVKKSEKAMKPEVPNQPWYVQELDRMSFADFIYPENEEQVLRDLQLALRSPWRTRVSKSF